MITKAAILKEIFESKEYSELCRKICGGNSKHRDLFQELYLILDSKPEQKIIDMYEAKTIKWFVIKILQTEWSVRPGNLSRFSKKYRDTGIDICITDIADSFIDTSTIEEEPLDLMEVPETELAKSLFVDKDDWYGNNVVKAYIKAGTMRNLAKETGINSASICYAVKSFKGKIKDKQIEYQNFMAEYNPKITLEQEAKKQIFAQAQKANLSPEAYIEKIIKEKANGKS